ncbi:TetR/AcrR family transcriptional regulator [Vagococcus sp. BWB3-3]|uniref:TetR/AcrR family transcriptional regulator n=1 Tax=Vagococcus allomyrinae TaxID=2794353 RepID=A0A940PBN6_9ENTE|nr:TetR/AcrR family transcriptional regulator [Vagococcus allomyrinae]MBP1043171.1 TetR/AcrR family transcriptional regulator [Vagococcus allomyrinae]
MGERDTQERLLVATVGLLSEASRPEKITARQIAKEAGANLAMINYFFKSKDELINLAIGQIMQEETDKFISVIKDDAEPKEQLFQVLSFFCETAIKYQRFLKLTIPYGLLTKEFKVESAYLEIIEEFYENRIPTAYCRMIALQIMSFTELLLLRADAFKDYSGIDILNVRQRQQYLRFQIELFLQPKNDD